MKTFGYSAFDDIERTDVPAGQLCTWCGEAIGETDAGVIIPRVIIGDADFDGVRALHEALHDDETVVGIPWHLECMMRSTLGSVAHQERRCSCFQKEKDVACEDPTRTRRENARAAAVLGVRNGCRPYGLSSK